MSSRFLSMRALAASAVVICLGGAWASADAQTDALRAKFQQRFPQVRAAKDAGKIGETAAGLVEAVDPAAAQQDAALAKLIAEEDADRLELYKLIAAQTNATPEIVAQRNAVRNFEKAKPGDYLKGADGVWKRKA